MYDRFKAKAEAAGNTEVFRFGTRTEAIEGVLQILQREGVADSPGSCAVWAESSVLSGLDRAGLAARVPGLVFHVTPERAKSAKVGISQMEWGVADTGTLAQDSTAADQRLVSTLPWVHVMLLPTDRIVPDLTALLSRVRPGQSSYLALITGPSKTADIERVLAIGVHGPERVVIICIDEPGGVN